ncbi:MAG: DUF551 domain-containing protein [Oscillibacter sp.]|nr:DUF551 domain-containing protein [Oscillibacter sp.]
MLNGLERTERWREVTDKLPPKVGYVIVAQGHYTPIGSRVDWHENAKCRYAYWDGRDFLEPNGNFPLRTVTHWMPFPRLPSEEAMRRVFRELLAEEAE